MMEILVKVVTVVCILTAIIRSIQGIVLAHYAIQRERKCLAEARTHPRAASLQKPYQAASQAEPDPLGTIVGLGLVGLVAYWLLRD